MRALVKQKNRGRQSGKVIKLHDRRACDLVRGASVTVVEVEDPYDPNDRIIAFRSLRDDPLARMQARGQVDAVEVLAGRHWQAAYERVEIGGARAIDPTREAVDGGRFSEPFTDGQRKAAKDLARAAKAVGMMGESVIRDVLACGFTMEMIAAARGYQGDQASIKFYGRLFRESLRTLSIVFGYAMAPRG